MLHHIYYSYHYENANVVDPILDQLIMKALYIPVIHDRKPIRCDTCNQWFHMNKMKYYVGDRNISTRWDYLICDTSNYQFIVRQLFELIIH